MQKRLLVRQALRFMLCTLPTDEQNVHNTSVYAANKNILQTCCFVCKHIISMFLNGENP